MGDSKIELFFLKNLLQIALAGVSIILLTDILLTYHDTRSVTIDLIILSAVLTSFILLKAKKYKSSVIVITSVPLITMFYQAVTFEDNTVPMTVILAIGFTFSILLKGRIMWFMHLVTIAGLLIIFSIQTQSPADYMKGNVNEVITLAVTFIVLYILVASTAGALKARYDRVNHELKRMNNELVEKSTEIEAQNEELVQSQDKVNALNQFLEQAVEEGSNRIVLQNEQLLRYAHVNAHHVRGPIARVLGLIQLSKIDPTVEMSFIFEKIERETEEIDSIITRINIELEKISE